MRRTSERSRVRTRQRTSICLDRQSKQAARSVGSRHGPSPACWSGPGRGFRAPPRRAAAKHRSRYGTASRFMAGRPDEHRAQDKGGSSSPTASPACLPTPDSGKTGERDPRVAHNALPRGVRKQMIVRATLRKVVCALHCRQQRNCPGGATTPGGAAERSADTPPQPACVYGAAGAAKHACSWHATA